MKPRILIIGGAGRSQMDSIMDRFRETGLYDVVNCGDYNGWSADLPKMLEDCNQAALLGHSFAGIPILKAASSQYGPAIWTKVKYVGLIDPVSCIPCVGSWELPDPKLRHLWIRRTQIGAEVLVGCEVPLNITNLFDAWKIDDKHNNIPHREDVITRLLGDVHDVFYG